MHFCLLWEVKKEQNSTLLFFSKRWSCFSFLDNIFIYNISEIGSYEQKCKIAFNFLLDLIGKIGLYFNFSSKCFNRPKVCLNFHSNALTCNGKCYSESCKSLSVNDIN